MSAPSSLPIAWGTVGAAPIAGFVNPSSWGLRFVTLSAAYMRNPPPGHPRPPFSGSASSSATAFAQTIPSGTRIQVFADEAAALVAAGAAAYS